MQEIIEPDHVDVVLTMLFFGDVYEDEGPVVDYSKLIEEDE